MNHPDGAHMRYIADALSESLKGYGFALFVFKFNEQGLAHYISNATRDTMLDALRETYKRLSKGQDIVSPENN
jgi:hypothetical protein